MADAEQVEEEVEEQIEQKFGLTLPVSRIDRQIRKAFPGKRVSAGTAVYVTAAVEAILTELVTESEKNRAASKKSLKSIDRRTFIAVCRASPDIGRFFRNFVFAPKKAIRVQRCNLLNAADAAVAAEKKKASKREKEEKKAVPGIDEE